MRKIIFILIIAFVLLSVIGVGCQQQAQQSQQQGNVTGILKGVSLSPKSFQSNDFTDFFVRARQVGNAVSWAGDWNELSKENNGAKVVTELSSTYGYIPVVEVQFFKQSDGKLLRALDNATKQSYKNNVVAFVEKYKPKYIGLGIEVNVLYEKSPSDFDEFVSFYSEVYDAIKSVSPNTKVFTVFQLEKMKGMNGGLFGGVNNQSKAEWFLIDKFKSDIVAFTTYPGLIYKNPSEIPQDYYSEIKSHTNKPVAFTEIGWHSATSPTGWESNESEQAAFVVKFFNLTRGLNKEIEIWSFLYDQSVQEPFNSMGLYYSDGKTKLAWNKWVAGN